MLASLKAASISRKENFGLQKGSGEASLAIGRWSRTSWRSCCPTPAGVVIACRSDDNFFIKQLVVDIFALGQQDA